MTVTKEQRKQKRRKQDDIPFDATAGAFQLKPACRYLGDIAPITLRRLVKSGKIKPNRELRYLIFPRVELDRFLAEGVSNGKSV